MKVYNSNIHLLIQTQLEMGKRNEFYKQNHFVMFCFALSTQNKMVISALIKELSFREHEVEEYIRKLKVLDIFKGTDQLLMNKISDSYKSKDFSQEIEEIKNHFNKVTNKKYRVSKLVRKNLKKLLDTGEYTVKDFKMVSLYFTRIWSENVKMSKFVSMDTFFSTTKFEDRLFKASEYFDELNKYSEERYEFCKAFKSRIISEYMKNDINEPSCSTVGFSCDNMPLQLQEILIFRLKQGYTIDQISLTVNATIESWSKNPKYANHIFIKKILDDGFEKRFLFAKRNAVKKVIHNRVGVDALDVWLSPKDKDKSYETLKNDLTNSINLIERNKKQGEF